MNASVLTPPFLSPALVLMLIHIMERIRSLSTRSRSFTVARSELRDGGHRTRDRSATQPQGAAHRSCRRAVVPLGVSAPGRPSVARARRRGAAVLGGVERLRQRRRSPRHAAETPVRGAPWPAGVRGSEQQRAVLSTGFGAVLAAASGDT